MHLVTGQLLFYFVYLKFFDPCHISETGLTEREDLLIASAQSRVVAHLSRSRLSTGSNMLFSGLIVGLVCHSARTGFGCFVCFVVCWLGACRDGFSIVIGARDPEPKRQEKSVFRQRE